MSANQIPRPGGGLTPSKNPAPVIHSCGRCWKNGGGGHTYTDLLRFARRGNS